jgi:hypothetical protein
MQKTGKKGVFDFLHVFESNRLRFDARFENIAVEIEMLNVAFQSQISWQNSKLKICHLQQSV